MSIHSGTASVDAEAAAIHLEILAKGLEQLATPGARRHIAHVAPLAPKPAPLAQKRYESHADLKETVVRSRADVRNDPSTFPSVRPKSLDAGELAEIPWGSFLRLLHSTDQQAGFASAASRSSTQEDLLESPWGSFLSTLASEPVAPDPPKALGLRIPRFDSGEIDAVISQLGAWE